MWSKTAAGRQEIQTRSKVGARAQRTLLLLVDGRRSDAELLAAVWGTTAADLDALAALGLIEAAAGTAPPDGAASAGAGVAAAALPTESRPAVQPAAASSHSAFAKTLTGLIARDLGLRGFTLTLEVEKARSSDELRAVAERVIAAIGERKGDSQGAAARQALYSRQAS